MRIHSMFVALCGAALVLASGSAVAAGKSGNSQTKNRYEVQILRTAYGIPHIQATDWGSLGYGYGYAFAQDNFCILARDVLVATGTQSRYFGPGAGSGNLISDWVYAMINADTRVNPAWNSLAFDTRDLLQGYAAGYNLYLREQGANAGAADCRGAEWVRPISGQDVYKMLRKLMVRAGTGNFAAAIVGASPPSPPLAAATAAPASAVEPATAEAEARLGVAMRQMRAAHSDALLAAAEPPDFRPERFGSNGLALGSELTGGSGALLGNPHFPWFGIERFYAVHLTIPGRYDVMGASIYGFPMVNIGFNRDVAWSHTVSTARRFVLRELRLAPGNATAYLYDGQVVPMQPETVSVDVLVGPGTVVPVPHTFYQTQFGPALIVPPYAAWTDKFAYALTDVNLENTRAFELYRDMGTARSVYELKQAQSKYVALPWVNTLAADSAGNAFYGDITVVPNVTAARLGACANTVVAQTLSYGARIYTLDGSTSACDPGTDADAPVPGIFGAGNLPSIVRRDYAQNSNDSYWLANPEARLEGYSPLIGTDEGKAQGFRTRLGITQVRDRLAGTDGLPGNGFGRQWLQDVLFGNRHYSADIMLDGVLTLCAEESHVVDLGGVTVDVTEACDVLAGWDGRNKITSVGTHLWTDFWNRARSAPGLYAVPFDPADPVNTPRSVNLASAAVRSRLMSDLAKSAQYFADNGIALDAPWGTVQFDVRNGESIPIHGGSGTSGVYNAISPGGLIPGVGYTPIFHGSSYIQAVTFTPQGPDARAIVTYSESTDPENPHYADMTRLFSQSGWVKLPFKEGDIRRDPELVVIKLNAPR
jgi:acyl-homoserine-lactone acylase